MFMFSLVTFSPSLTTLSIQSPSRLDLNSQSERHRQSAQ